MGGTTLPAALSVALGDFYATETAPGQGAAAERGLKVKIIYYNSTYVTLTLTLEPPACLDDNTAYYGNNIGDPRKSIDSSDCQERCERRNRCEFWSFDKGWGECWLKTSKAGEPATTKRYGPVYPGNNHNYVSGSKYCIHVSRSI